VYLPFKRRRRSCTCPYRQRLEATLLVLLWIAGPGAGHSQPVAGGLQAGDDPTRPGEVRFAPYLTLDAVSASEITFGRPLTVDMGLGGGGGAIDQNVPVRLWVTRSIPTVWRILVMDTVVPASVDVQYEVYGANGKPWRLTHVEHPEAELGVMVEPVPPRLVPRDGDSAVLEGGLVLQVSLDQTRFAGTYTGTLVVTVNNL
jgi:hypothetical protein